MRDRPSIKAEQYYSTEADGERGEKGNLLELLVDGSRSSSELLVRRELWVDRVRRLGFLL